MLQYYSGLRGKQPSEALYQWPINAAGSHSERKKDFGSRKWDPQGLGSMWAGNDKPGRGSGSKRQGRGRPA